jgi:class 3 adenylate cyclase/HAMP domain-containing protein
MQKQDAGFVDYGKTFGGNEAFLAFAKIPSPDWSVGAVFPKAELFAEADMLNNRMRLLAIGGGLLLFVVSLLVSRSITGPLRRMARLAAGITNRIGSRQHSEKLSIDLTDISPRDEIGQLARAFMDLGSEVNRYMEKRNFIRATFGRYLSKEMVTRLLGARNDETQGERTREITVLVSSLRGFQTMCAGLDTGQSVTLINRYLTEMVDILLDGEGMVDAIHRDGLVALFGAHRQTDNHAEQAVVCALKMQMALDKINSSNHEENLPHLEMGVAISSGPVFIGAIDHQSCDQCTLNGSEAELAQVMEPYALGGRILVSPSTRDHLAEKIAIAGTVRVTPDGWRDEVTLSLIEGIEGDHWIRLSKRDEQPVPLRHPLEASATPIEGAGGAPEELSVTITAISMTAAMVTASQEFPDWTQLRVQLLDSQSGEPQGNFFGTVVEVRSAGTGYEHQIRLGSMCAHSHQVILDATGRAKAQLI